MSDALGIFHPMWLIAALMAAVLVMHEWGFRRIRFSDFRWTMGDLLFFGFVGMVGASLLWSDIEQQSRALRYLFAALLFPYCFARFASPRDIRVFAWSVPALSAGLMILVLISLAALGYRVLAQERVYLFWGLPAHQVFPIDMAFLALSMVAIPPSFCAKRAYFRVLIAGIVFLSVATIALLGARAVLVACVATVSLVLVLGAWQPVRFRLAYFVTIICAIVFAVSISPPEKRWFFGQLLDIQSIPHEVPRIPDECKIKDNSMAIRTILYREGIAAFVENPLTGVGAGRFGFYSCYYEHEGEFNSPHSTVIHAFSELGLIGGVLFLAPMLWAVYWVLQQIARWRDGQSNLVLLVGPMFIFCVILDQMSSSYLTALHYYLLLGIIVALRWQSVRSGGDTLAAK